MDDSREQQAIQLAQTSMLTIEEARVYLLWCAEPFQSVGPLNLRLVVLAQAGVRPLSA